MDPPIAPTSSARSCPRTNGERHADGRGGAFPAPFAYQAHLAKFVDPHTGVESKLTIVPMCNLLSYQNGFSTMGTGDIDAHLAPFNDPAHPSIALMAHDGDNAWGGGNDYYQASVKNLFNEAAGKGYRPTTIQQFYASSSILPQATWFTSKTARG